MNPKIAKVVVGLPVDGPFDYAVGPDLRGRIAVGQRVRVSFNRRNRVGFVVGSASRSAFKRLNPILSLLDESPALDGHAVALAKQLSDYYGCSLGEAFETVLPAVLRKDGFSLSAQDQTPAMGKDAPADIGRPVLIHDQTMDQRWTFVADHINDARKKGKRAIVLVPEKSFIKDAVTRLEKLVSGAVSVYQTPLAPKKELEQWERILQGQYDVVVGTRSAVFAPVPGLGLIFINDEENGAYKQEQAPHYHACEVAQMRAAIDQAQVILASALPTAEAWHEAKRKRWEVVRFADTRDVQVKLVDMTNYNPRRTSILSFPLQNAMQAALEQGGKVILYMNRLGFSTRTRCQQCGYIVKCERCDVNLTYLYSKKVMVCRHCNVKRDRPKVCPQCNGSYMKSSGTGVEKLESEVARLYPQARIAHYERSSKKFPSGAEIIIATQAIFRGQAHAKADLVALLNFDAQLHHVDFRSGHKTLALLVHLRQLAKAQLLIQTRMKDNDCIEAIKSLNFDRFYRKELKLRKELDLPPAKHMIAIGLRGKKEEVVFAQCNELFDALERVKPKSVEVSDPHPDVNPKMRDRYRFTITLKGRSVKAMLALVKKTLKGLRKKSAIITVNVDP